MTDKQLIQLKRYLNDRIEECYYNSEYAPNPYRKAQYKTAMKYLNEALRFLTKIETSIE